MKKRDREYTLGHVSVAPSSLSPNGLQAHCTLLFTGMEVAAQGKRNWIYSHSNKCQFLTGPTAGRPGEMERSSGRGRGRSIKTHFC
jgi:hypothetical protein